MKIVEKFVKGKFNKEELCEDGICVTENFIALIDGVTSNNDEKNPVKATAFFSDAIAPSKIRN